MKGKSNLKKEIENQLNNKEISYNGIKVTEKTITIMMEDLEATCYEIKQCIDNALEICNIDLHMRIMIEI